METKKTCSLRLYEGRLDSDQTCTVWSGSTNIAKTHKTLSMIWMTKRNTSITKCTFFMKLSTYTFFSAVFCIVVLRPVLRYVLLELDGFTILALYSYTFEYHLFCPYITVYRDTKSSVITIHNKYVQYCKLLNWHLYPVPGSCPIPISSIRNWTNTSTVYQTVTF